MNREESFLFAQEVHPAPRRLGPYELQGILGSGGMGVVYLGCHQDTGQRVALKTVRITSEPTLASLRQEVRTLSQLHHPGIIRIVDHGLFNEQPWYAMELMEGLTLRQVIERYWGTEERSSRFTTTPSRKTDTSQSGPPPWKSSELPGAPLLKLVRRLCTPLAWLHGLGLIHRDLKPTNLFIRRDGSVVLGDFGVATEFGGASGREVLQVDNGGVGTPLYMAPEQIRGDLVDARADLYSLGCILYECLTGVPPFPSGSSRAIRRRHLQERPLQPSLLLGEELPEQLEWLTLKLLEKQPEERLGYAEDVARVLEELGLRAGEARAAPRPRPYLYRPLFTGREDAVRRIQARLDELTLGRGGLIFIGGGSGVGKTRLAMEMAREAFLRELNVVTGECIPLGLSGTRVSTSMKAPPLHPFRPLLARVADLCRLGGTEKTARLLGPRGKVLLPFEPGLDELPGQRELPPPPPLASEEAARTRIFTSLWEVLLASTASEPLLLILDDLQWADELTLGFLRWLRHEELVKHEVLLLGTYRLEEREEPLREVVSQPEALHLELGRLDEQSIQSMACGMLALRSLPPDFDVLVRQSDGNPFFVAEYLRAAIAEGLLHRDSSGRWRLDTRTGADRSFHTLALPGSLAEIIRLRLSGLDVRSQRLVELAAVLGRDFEAELLLETTPSSEQATLEELETLRVRQILETAAGGALRFVHDKLRENAYAAIPPERCRQLHHRAAETIERRCTQAHDCNLRYASLAHHWARSEVHDRASHFFGLAADNARAALANGEALTFYRMALAEARAHLPPGADEPLEWREKLRHFQERLGDLLSLSGSMEEARAAYAEALNGFPPEQRLPRARIHRKVGKTWETHHRHEQALHAYAEAEAALGPAPVEEGGQESSDWWQQWVQLQVDRHWIYYWLDRLEEMSTHVERLRAVVEKRGTPLQRSIFFQTLITMSLRRDRYQVSAELVEYGRLAVEAGVASGDLATEAVARFCHSYTLLFHGELDASEQQGLTGLRMAERLGDLTLQARFLTYLTLGYRERGEVERTREYCERSLATASAIRMNDYVGTARANQAWVAWQQQQVEQAEQEGRAALECWRSLSAVYPFPQQWMALWILLAAALRRQAVAEAVEHAGALLAPTQFRQSEPVPTLLETAITAWHQGQQEVACKSLEHATEWARRYRQL